MAVEESKTIVPPQQHQIAALNDVEIETEAPVFDQVAPLNQFESPV